jgi:hypothetical protein
MGSRFVVQTAINATDEPEDYISEYFNYGGRRRGYIRHRSLLVQSDLKRDWKRIE